MRWLRCLSLVLGYICAVSVDAESWQRYTCIGQLSVFKLNSFAGNLADGRTPEEEFELLLGDRQVVIEGTTSFDDEYPRLSGAPFEPIRFQLDSGRRCKSGVFTLEGLTIYLERSAQPGCGSAVGTGGEYTLQGQCRFREKAS